MYSGESNDKTRLASPHPTRLWAEESGSRRLKDSRKEREKQRVTPASRWWWGPQPSLVIPSHSGRLCPSLDPTPSPLRILKGEAKTVNYTDPPNSPRLSLPFCKKESNSMLSLDLSQGSPADSAAEPLTVLGLRPNSANRRRRKAGSEG